jgi:glycogen debranching enzyme
LAIAPELFTPERAINHIKKVEKYLLQPKSIGVATLADMHTPYSPFYDNSDDSNDYRIAHGYSYHNGPEWVWLYGFYLVAKINFQSGELSKRKMMTLLQEHVKYL